MKVYIVSAFSAEEYSNDEWVDSVFSSLSAAQAYINSHKNQNGYSVKLGGDGEEYFLSDYITTREVKD